MYVCMYGHHIKQSMDQPGKVANPARGQLNREKKIPCPRACLRIWSRETGSAVPSRVSLIISILRLNLVLTYGIPLEFRGGVHFMKPPYAIGSVPSLSGHAIAYRWRSLPRVRRHRASKPQGSSERVLPWQITMDQLIFASLSHTHYWYEVGMLKVPKWSAEQGKRIFPCTSSSLRIWSRETGSAVPSRVSLLVSILRLNLVLEFPGGV